MEIKVDHAGTPTKTSGVIVYDSFEPSFSPTVTTCDVYNSMNQKVQTFNIDFTDPFKHRYDHRIYVDIVFDFGSLVVGQFTPGNNWLTINCGGEMGHFLYSRYEGVCLTVNF